ncbi:sodium-independent sulfate anion transporter [Plakobranchus ocellatus]|uniref:Sodium-independent sulfate anion transporter n=1 Tax=Plakobranchus ocellatus TaxID=259542 RepID=A0AAV4CJZ8_9GAST|nr:sodium-independent sulfate anion transporter [Plakobranchus ocellatus]
MNSQSALRSAGTLLSRVGAQSSAPWPDGGPESLRSPCGGLIKSWTAKKTNDTVLEEAHTTRLLISKIRKRQATFFGHVMRREKLENLVTTGMLEGKRSRGKQREKLIEGLTDWLKAGKSLEAIEATKDRKKWRTMIANAPAGNGHHGVGNSDNHKAYRDDVEGQGGREEDLSIKERVRNCCSSTCTVQNALGKLPIVSWLPKYRCQTFQSDLIAGLTVGLTVIPQGLAYAQVAGLSPEYGLYSAFMGCFVYAFMGTSKDITLGPTAIMSLMTAEFGSSKSPCLKLDEDGGCEFRDPTLAILLTLLSGVIELTMGVLQLGILVNYISYPVINAFTSAAAISIAVGQLKTVLGLKDVSREFLHQVYDICRKVPETRVWDMAMGVVAIIACFLLKKLRTIKWRGENDPDADISIPVMIMRKLVWLCGTGANAIVVIVSAAIIAIVDSQDVDIEHYVTVTGNITGGLPPLKLPAFEVSSENGTTVLSTSGVFSTLGAGIGIVPLLALVETMAIGKAFARANNYKIQPTQELLAIELDLIPLVVTFIGSLTIGIEYGILVGIGVSLLMLLYPIARPKVKYTFTPGALIVTPAQGVNFPAAEYLELKAMEKAKDANGKLRHIILNMVHLSDLDYTAIQSVKSLMSDCELDGIRFIIAGGSPSVREKLQNANLKTLVLVESVKDALDELSLQGGPSIDGIRYAAHDLSARAVPQAKTSPSIGHSTTSQHNTSQPIMDWSDKYTLVMLTKLNNQKKKTRRIMWYREHFLLRSSRKELYRTFCSLMTRRDETLLFNNIRMSYRMYEELKNLVLPHLQPIG